VAIGSQIKYIQYHMGILIEPNLRGWGGENEPWLDEERLACLQGIHQGWMGVDSYTLELFSEWPEE